MFNPPDILTLAYKQAPMQEQMALLHEKEQQMPGSVQYTIRRYTRNHQWNMEEYLLQTERHRMQYVQVGNVKKLSG